MKNKEIRNLANEQNVFLWEVAEKLGVSDITLSKRLRREVSNDDKAKIINIIEVISKNRGKNNEKN